MRLRVFIAAVVMLVGLSWLGWSLRQGRLASQPDPLGFVPPPKNEIFAEPATPVPSAVPSAPLADVAPPIQAADAATPVPAAISWGDRRDEILTSGASADEKADSFLALLPTLAGADQEEAARHLVNLLSDEHFLAAAGYLTNAQVPEAVQTILLADLLNRPEAVKLPLWLAVARAEDHPRAAEAKEFLALSFSEDYETNWSAWEAAVQARLQAAP
jgi:hypothetical protein